MNWSEKLHDFFFPEFNWKFFLRVGVLACVAYLVFGYLFLPCLIQGGSMEPTYNSFGFNFCWTGAFWNQPPQLGDVVIVKYADRTFYLKRVIGLPGDEISFVNGTLYRNGQPCPEEYVKKPCDWNLEARIVEEDCYYLCGDNRSMPMQNHEFGQVSKRRIIGTPLW